MDAPDNNCPYLYVRSDGLGLFWALAMFDLNNSVKAMNGKVANHAYQRWVAPSATKALACIYNI